MSLGKKKYDIFAKTQLSFIGLMVICALIKLLCETSFFGTYATYIEGVSSRLLSLFLTFFAGLSVGGILKERESAEIECEN